MIVDSIYFKGHTCFKNEWSGFDTIKPINVIIGRNNSGKSHLLDLVETLCSGQFDEPDQQYRCKGVLDERSLKRVFDEHSEHIGGHLPGNRWHQYGQHLVGVEITWETDNAHWRDLILPEEVLSVLRLGEESTSPLRAEIGEAVRVKVHQLTGRSFRRLLADRDIQPERQKHESRLGADGEGATNLIRRFLLSTDPESPRHVVRDKILRGLNLIFANEGKFSEILPQLHEKEPKDHWEIYLGEDKKGLIPLSRSGSGLKTVLLVLLNLLVMPEVASRAESRGERGERGFQFVFAFEELENNLHPALLRRLFRYLEDYAVAEQATIFLTTHSSTALDYFGTSQHAQIIRVSHDGESAHATRVSAHFDRLGLVSELGARPSDLLQANGIVWVEGPSDRVYLNRWIELCSDGRLREGRNYQCAFYGGALLARAQFTPLEETDEELANLFQVNPNIVVVCDGDRASRHSPLKPRVRRIREEVEKTPDGHIWVTRAREIENYLPGGVLKLAVHELGWNVSSLPDPGQFDNFFPRKRSPRKSYAEANLQRRHFDKVELAMRSAPHMTRELMESRFDWNEQMTKVVERIESWNG